MLELHNIYKSYKEAPLLRGVSLRVSPGETVCLLGPSGSGKSTLLRIISGLESAESGDMSWDGKDLFPIPPHRRNFGLIFQDYALFPHLNVFENVAFGLKMQNVGRNEIRRRVGDALEQVDLAGKDLRRVTELSGGEQQRVALARALAPCPRLLLFDEPLGALDRRLREYLLTELRNILRESGVPAIYVTHDQEEAFALGDHVMLLYDGKIVQSGSPAAIYARPVSRWVAEFLGAGNVLDGTVLENGAVKTVLGILNVPCTKKQNTGAFVTLLIRPQDVRRADSSSLLQGRVVDVIFQQHSFRVVLESGFYFNTAEAPQTGDKIGLEITLDNIQCLI